METQQQFIPGLEGVVAAQTLLSSVDGEKGELLIAGYSVEDIAPHASFEEILFLLWHDKVPTGVELSTFQKELAKYRELPQGTLTLLQKAAQKQIDPMDTLRMACSSLSLHGETHTLDKDALIVVGAFPTIVATYRQLLLGQKPLPVRLDLSHAAHYLYLLTGKEPNPAQIRGMETYLNTVIDHGLNASTFTARVIISTGSDLISAVTGAVGALKGPLHGGAPGPALDLVFEIKTKERAEGILRKKIESGERLMGFGHRVYRVRDPRAEVLSQAAKTMFEQGKDQSLYLLSLEVEQVALRLLQEYKPNRKIQTNVEFYTALLLHGLGLETSLFTPTFAISRVGGWVAHCLEQMKNNRLIRPQSVYVGQGPKTWIPLEKRSSLSKP